MALSQGPERVGDDAERLQKVDRVPSKNRIAHFIRIAPRQSVLVATTFLSLLASQQRLQEVGIENNISQLARQINMGVKMDVFLLVSLYTSLNRTLKKQTRAHTHI